ncbi:MAG: VWA domain-containing protein [Chitinophagales bacterium]
MPLISFSQQEISITRILFLLDGSSSMAEAWSNTTKVEAAKRIITQIADSLNASGNVQLALRVYGHQSLVSENNCTDTKLEVPFASHNAQTIRTALNVLRPKGITPIAYSLEQSGNDFPNDPHARNVVMLVTDGEESCGGDPCAVSLKLQQKHIFLRPFVIGLNLNPDAADKMNCIGNYYNAQSPEVLRSVMKTAVSRALLSAAVQVNLLDAQNRPLETDVNMTFYDDATGVDQYNFYHTITNSGVPDTMQIDPVPQYNLTIHTTPEIERQHLNFSAKKIDTVNIAASQGFLKIVLEGKTINQNLNDKIQALVRKSGSDETIDVQKLYETKKYLSGKYDLEVLTLPRMNIKNIAVTQSSTTTVTVPLPGILSVSKSFSGIGAVMLSDGDKLEKIYQLNENSNYELIGLQAGNYEIIFRSKFSKRTSETIVKKFSIKSGETTSIKL